MKFQELKNIAHILRGRTIETSHKAEVPHLGSCLSCIDILVALYWHILRIDPKRPDQEERDRFILSKGHGAPALFQVLAMKGFFDESLLQSFNQDGSLFGEHPPAHGVPGIEAATGSLGHGLPIAVGLALGARIRGLNSRVYALLSDGECNEGSTWEAALFAGAQKLDHLMVIIDFNKWQATGRSEEIMALSPLKEKWISFGWEAVEIDGHDFLSLTSTMSALPSGIRKPIAVVAHTIKGKGISFMEDDNNWHYRIPSQDEVNRAKQELGLIEVEYAECVCR